MPCACTQFLIPSSTWLTIRFDIKDTRTGQQPLHNLCSPYGGKYPFLIFVEVTTCARGERPVSSGPAAGYVHSLYIVVMTSWDASLTGHQIVPSSDSDAVINDHGAHRSMTAIYTLATDSDRGPHPDSVAVR